MTATTTIPQEQAVELRPIPTVARLGGTADAGGPSLHCIDRDGFLAPPPPRNSPTSASNRRCVDQLALKISNLVSSFTTEWITCRLGLPLHLVHEICWQLRQEKMIEVLGEIAPFNYRYSITQRGRDTAGRLMELSGYTGPTPVSLNHYTEMLSAQAAAWPRISMADAEQALGDMVVTKETVEIATLAAVSGRGLFVFGPAGNGKTSLGRALQRLMRGTLWIPHAISIDNAVIRLFDSQMHRRQPGFENDGKIDQRWACIERPFVVTGGEMTLEDVDLAYQPVLRCYEAPAHVKANGGVFMIDDFGRQRVDPKTLLNRWIVPLEERVDFLTLDIRTEDPHAVQTAADHRDQPHAERGRRSGVPATHGVSAADRKPDSDRLPTHLRALRFPQGNCHRTGPARLHRRPLSSGGPAVSGCEPRDLLERALDVFRLRGCPFQLDREVLDIAWFGYFGGIHDMTAPADTILRSGATSARPVNVTGSS